MTLSRAITGDQGSIETRPPITGDETRCHRNEPKSNMQCKYPEITIIGEIQGRNIYRQGKRKVCSFHR
jgi:hypothetical protein